MIHIGTAGWSYPTGEGTWNGVFYPRGTRVDPLSIYARFFDLVEVNSTFYRTPAPEVTRAWARKTPADFQFAVKLFQKFTHPRMFEAATGRQATIDMEDFARFERAVAPLAEAGKLGPVLAQFPPSFKRTDQALDYLADLLTQLRAYRVVVELRHASWTSDAAADRLLADLGVSWAHTDEPRRVTHVGQVPRVGRIGYFRFHGRNARDWWRGDSDARYNYLYSLAEQAHLAKQVTEVARVATSTHVIYNNHYGGKAVANALQMKILLGQPVPDDLPAPLLAAFPDLERLLRGEDSQRSATDS